MELTPQAIVILAIVLIFGIPAIKIAWNGGR